MEPLIVIEARQLVQAELSATREEGKGLDSDKIATGGRASRQATFSFCSATFLPNAWPSLPLAPLAAALAALPSSSLMLARIAARPHTQPLQR